MLKSEIISQVEGQGVFQGVCEQRFVTSDRKHPKEVFKQLLKQQTGHKETHLQRSPKTVAFFVPRTPFIVI